RAIPETSVTLALPRCIKGDRNRGSVYVRLKDMNQAIHSKRAIRQDLWERTLDRIRKEMDVSPVARSAREGLGEPDRADKQKSVGIKDEGAPKSKAINPKVNVAARRQARWLFHYEQEQDRPAQRQRPIVGPKRTNKRRGE